MADEPRSIIDFLQDLKEGIESRDNEVEELKSNFKFQNKLIKDTRTIVTVVLVACVIAFFFMLFDYIIYHTDIGHGQGQKRIEHCVHPFCRQPH